MATESMCSIEKDLKLVGVLNSNHWKKDGWKGTRNACKIGLTNNKIARAYIVTLDRDEEGKEVLKVHTIKRNEDDVIETLEGRLAERMFKKLSFY